MLNVVGSPFVDVGIYSILARLAVPIYIAFASILCVGSFILVVVIDIIEDIKGPKGPD